jgi:hypothetical protein
MAVAPIASMAIMMVMLTVFILSEVSSMEGNEEEHV